MSLFLRFVLFTLVFSVYLSLLIHLLKQFGFIDLRPYSFSEDDVCYYKILSIFCFIKNPHISTWNFIEPQILHSFSLNLFFNSCAIFKRSHLFKNYLSRNISAIWSVSLPSGKTVCMSYSGLQSLKTRLMT